MSTSFALGLPPTLENDRVRVELFNCDHHLDSWLAGTAAHPSVLFNTSFPNISTAESFRQDLWDPHFAGSKSDCLFAIIAKQNPSSTSPTTNRDDTSFAGILSLSDTSPSHFSTDLGIMLLPAHHGTGVAANAVGLVLCWLLDPLSPSPSSPPSQTPGRGLRRVTWRASVANTASRGFAARMGFEFEGVARWDRVVPVRGGAEAAAGERPSAEKVAGKGAPGRHTAVYSLVWEEWAEKRERVVVEMGRRGRR